MNSLRALGLTLLLAAGVALAQSPHPAEPDEGGIGGTGNALEDTRKPELVDRPDLPERIEHIDPIENPGNDVTMPDGSDVEGAVDVDPPPADHH